jgi:glutamate dehydrogenase/leucine dehydrogenase
LVSNLESGDSHPPKAKTDIICRKTLRFQDRWVTAFINAYFNLQLSRKLKMSKSEKSIAVIGAGITGITSAYSLMQRGFKVTVFDRNRYAAMETSYANGGQLSASNAEVWNKWSTVFKGMK